MSAKGMISTVLATGLAEAVAADINEGSSFDLAAGTFGPNVSNWLRELAEHLTQPTPQSRIVEA